jgi:regulator of sirC expression with transglutaminase-like and TPR domain
MINTTGEINALLNLIEDPDDEVYQTITRRFIGFGQEIIPVLNEFKEITEDSIQLAKINSIISQICISGLKNSVADWLNSDDQSVLEATLFIAAYLDPEHDRDRLFFEIEKIRKTIWLELNDYLTPLEEINILNKIIFGHYNYKGLEIDFGSTPQFDPSYLLNNKLSNTFPLASVYLIIAEMLGITISPVDIPKQNLLCYVEEGSSIISVEGSDILFYIDPLNGQVYTHRDVENYVKKMNLAHPPVAYAPSNARNFVQRWLKGIAKAEQTKGEVERFNALLEIIATINAD